MATKIQAYVNKVSNLSKKAQKSLKQVVNSVVMAPIYSIVAGTQSVFVALVLTSKAGNKYIKLEFDNGDVKYPKLSQSLWESLQDSEDGEILSFNGYFQKPRPLSASDKAAIKSIPGMTAENAEAILERHQEALDNDSQFIYLDSFAEDED